MKKTPLIIILVILIAGAAVYFLWGSPLSPVSGDNQSNASSTTSASGSTGALADADYVKTDVTAPSGTIHAFVADNDEKMELGLSFRNSLAEDSGMIFVFNEPDVPQFWMKDMKFPLDIIWINEDRQVVGIVSNLSPDTYPNSVLAPSSILYVLELNAGAAQKFGIATSTTLGFDVGDGNVVNEE